MKNIVVGCCSIVFLLMTLLVVFTVYGNVQREKEATESLNYALAQTIRMMEETATLPFHNEEDMIAYFETILLVQIDGAEEVRVSVLAADAKKGLLSVEVAETYTKLNGKTGEVVSRQTAILEDANQAIYYGEREISYFVEETLYRRYEVDADMETPQPPEPQKEGCCFMEWKAREGANDTYDAVFAKIQTD